MLIIGSTAIKKYYPGFPREPKDLDVAVPTKDFDKKDFRSIYISSEDKLEYLVNPVLYKYQVQGHLRPSLMLTLKISHLFWDINWEKHLFDVQFLLKKGVSYNSRILDELVEYWEEVHPKVRRSELEMTKEDFFTNNVNEDVDEHDFLHTLINPVPMFTRLLREGAEVELDEDKWNALTHEEKLEVCREETYVMAYERYCHKGVHHRRAFRKQLKDNIIKHFPRYIAIFAILCYPELEKPMYNYYQTIQNGLERRKA